MSRAATILTALHRPVAGSPSATRADYRTEAARTVAIAQRAAALLTDVSTCCALLQAALHGPDRVRVGAAVSLLCTAGQGAAVTEAARRNLVDAVTAAALAHAAAEVAP